MSSASLSPATELPAATGFDEGRQRSIVRRELARHSFCTLATSSGAQRPHVAGVLYALVGNDLYLTIHDDSVKARNIADNPRVAVCVPIRKVPFFPPFAIQFQATATLLDSTDPEITRLVATGALKKILTGIDLEDPTNRFVRITPGRRISTYGLGVPLLQVIRQPTTAMRSIDWRDTTGR